MRWIEVAAGYLFVAGVLYLGLHVAGFSMKQSITLALLIALLLRAPEVHRAAAGCFRFKPYRVSVTPNWAKLLLDFKLVGNLEEWHGIQKSFEELPLTKYCVLRNGISFEMVYQSVDNVRRLVYSDDYRAFLSDVKFSEDMSPIRIEQEHQAIHAFGNLTPPFAEVFVWAGIDGYNLGIEVPDWWWDEAKALCPKPVEVREKYSTQFEHIGRLRLTLATISYREFDLYWEPDPGDWTFWSMGFYNKTAKRRGAQRDEQRKKFDWETGKTWGAGEHITHKYFDVYHQEI